MKIIKKINSIKLPIILAFLLNALAIFILLILIHYQLDHSILFSSLWKNPIAFWEFYLPRILFSLGASSIILYVKNKLWAIIPLALLTILYFVVRSLSFIGLDLYVIVQCISLLFILKKVDEKHRLEYLKKYNKINYIYSVLFALIVLCQCFIFHILSFNEYQIFLKTIFLKLSLILILTTIAFLVKNKRWLIVFDFLIVLWMFAEFMYYRANGIYMDAFTITMAGNMNGFWASLKTLYMPKDFLLLIPMSFLILPYICKQSNQRSIDGALLTFSLGVVINLLACVEFQSEKLTRKINKETTTDISRIELNPFSEYAMGQLSGVTMPDYIKTLSVLHAFIYNVKDYLRISVLTPEVSFSTEEMNILEKIVNKNNVSVNCKIGGGMH